MTHQVRFKGTYARRGAVIAALLAGLAFDLPQAAQGATPLPPPRPHNKAANVSLAPSAPIPTRLAGIPVPPLRPGGEPPQTADVADAEDGTAIATDDPREEVTFTEGEIGGTPAPAAPLPAVRPDKFDPAKIISRQDYVALKESIDLIRKRDFIAALLKRDAIADPLGKTLFDWLYVRDETLNAGFTRIATFMRDHPDWPHQQTLRARMETTLFESHESTKTVLAAFAGTPPLTGAGKAALARAHLEQGRADKAEQFIRDAWTAHTLTPSQEDAILETFGKVLTAKDQKARLNFLLYRNLASSAMRAAKRLGKDATALANARLAVARRLAKAQKLLDALPASVRKDPVAQLSRVELLRRQGKDVLATGLLLSAPTDPDILGSPVEWWQERRILVRRMLDKKDYKSAYKLAKDHSTRGGLAHAEAEFLAGWIALRYLNQPKQAADHFHALRKAVSTGISISRAEYWLGRAYETLGEREKATTHYTEASERPFHYYGQLARLKLGKSAAIAVAAPPATTEAEKQRFAKHDLVRAAQLFYDMGETRIAASFLMEMAYSLNNTAELALAADLARMMDMVSVAVRIGKVAIERDRPLHHYAYLIDALPEFKPRDGSAEPALVNAIVRQESQFNPAAISGAGARGLMQLMPSTAKLVAKQVGAPYNLTRLTSDPSYNASLGAFHLGDLVGNFGGSYIMAVAAYNAGPRRVAQWVEAFGDPRLPSVDAIDWIERIPFTETRNYVQRVMENLQVYRARLNGNTHPIELAADLKRGG